MKMKRKKSVARRGRLSRYAAEMGRSGGSKTSPAKTAANRRNIEVRWAKRRAEASSTSAGALKAEVEAAQVADHYGLAELDKAATEIKTKTQAGIAGTWTTPESK